MSNANSHHEIKPQLNTQTSPIQGFMNGNLASLKKKFSCSPAQCFMNEIQVFFMNGNGYTVSLEMNTSFKYLYTISIYGNTLHFKSRVSQSIHK